MDPPIRMAFTLVETLVSLALIALLLVVLMSMINQVTGVWRMTSGKIEQFQESREAFETITRRLSTATLNTYWDYDNPTTPTRYVRQSELRFLSGRMATIASGVTPPTGTSWHSNGLFFQAPLGISEPGQPQLWGLYSLLNTRGYFVEFGDASRPNIPGITSLPGKYRFRLCELIQPANELTIYNQTSGIATSGTLKNLAYTGRDWFTDALGKMGATRPVHVLAENVIALVLLPHVSVDEDVTGTKLAPDYLYDSTATKADANFNPKNQLPPMVQVTMVALDERSAIRLDRGGATPPDFGIDMDSLFQQASLFDVDLKNLEDALASKRIQYRVFTTNVRIKGAKWSNEQKN